jgi:O6-methylguanine-DNA--protein-cysteine methyltransferase
MTIRSAELELPNWTALFVRFFLTREKAPGDDCETRATPLMQKAARHLVEYFNGKRNTFALIFITGEGFQKNCFVSELISFYWLIVHDVK